MGEELGLGLRSQPANFPWDFVKMFILPLPLPHLPMSDFSFFSKKKVAWRVRSEAGVRRAMDSNLIIILIRLPLDG